MTLAHLGPEENTHHMLRDMGRIILVGRATEIITELEITLKNLVEERTMSPKILAIGREAMA